MPISCTFESIAQYVLHFRIFFPPPSSSVSLLHWNFPSYVHCTVIAAFLFQYIRGCNMLTCLSAAKPSISIEICCVANRETSVNWRCMRKTNFLRYIESITIIFATADVRLLSQLEIKAHFSIRIQIERYSKKKPSEIFVFVMLLEFFSVVVASSLCWKRLTTKWSIRHSSSCCCFHCFFAGMM